MIAIIVLLGILSLIFFVLTVAGIVEIRTESCSEVCISPLSKWWFKRKESKEKIDNEINNYNTLYKCDCGMYFRRYQADLYSAKHGKTKCPHCEIHINKSSRDYFHVFSEHYYYGNCTEISNEEVIMALKHHPSCPIIIDLEQLKEIKKSIQAYKELNETNKYERIYREYDQKAKDSTKWIHNIQYGGDKK